MDVFLVPIGDRRHELYCEARDEPGALRLDEVGGSWAPAVRVWRFLVGKFSLFLTAVEHEHEHGSPTTEPAGRIGRLVARVRPRVVRWLAERIAEQRLLWRLRGQRSVRVHHPDDLPPERALAIVRDHLKADADRHLRWLLVNTAGMLGSLVLVPFPGPNVPGYYFTFRVVGHLLAIRGARHGLRQVRWDLVPSPLLNDLASLGRLSSGEREARVHAIGQALGLARLERFFSRVVPGLG